MAESNGRRAKLFDMMDRCDREGGSDLAEQIEREISDLGASQDEEAADILLEILRERGPKVGYFEPGRDPVEPVHWASQALRDHESEKVVRSLLDLLMSGEEWAVYHVVDALTGRDTDEVNQALEMLLRIGDDLHKLAAVGILGDRVEPQFTDALAAAATNVEASFVRIQIAFALRYHAPSAVAAKALVDIMVDSRGDANTWNEARTGLRYFKTAPAAGYLIDELNAQCSKFVPMCLKQYFLDDAEGLSKLIEALEERRAKLTQKIAHDE